jgi:hypothetical protein
LTSTPGAGSAARAGPIGISGDAATATATAISAPPAVTAARRARDSATSAPRVAPMAQHGQFRRVQGELPAEQLAEHGQRDQAGEGREGGQRDGLRADRLLERGDLVGRADDVDPPAGSRLARRARVALRERARGGDELLGHRSARPEAHGGLVAVAGRAGDRGRRERRARQDGGRAVAAVGDLDLRVERHDGGHQERDRDRLGEVGGAGGRIVRHDEQPHGAARLQVLRGGHVLVDHRLAGRVRIEETPGQHPDPVRARPERAVRARHELHFGVPVARQRRLVKLTDAHGLDLRQPRQGGVVPVLAGGAPRHDVQLRGVRPGHQPGVDGIGAPRPRRRGQHDAADEPEQQREAEQCPPPVP